MGRTAPGHPAVRGVLHVSFDVVTSHIAMLANRAAVAHAALIGSGCLLSLVLFAQAFNGIKYIFDVLVQ